MEKQRSMKQHAEETYPYECCGFIIGIQSDDINKVKELIPADNSHKGEKRRRFFIDPLSYLKAEKIAEEKKLAIIGVYHSHPDHPPIPSDEDKRHALPGFHYPIITVKNGIANEIRSWMLGNTREFKEETIFKNQFN